MIGGLQGGSHPHDLCSIRIASNLMVSLLLGGEELLQAPEVWMQPS